MKKISNSKKVKQNESMNKVTKKNDLVSKSPGLEMRARKRSIRRNPNHNNSDLLSKISSIEHLARVM